MKIDLSAALYRAVSDMHGVDRANALFAKPAKADHTLIDDPRDEVYDRDNVREWAGIGPITR